MGIVEYDGRLKKLSRDPPLAPLKPSTLRKLLSIEWWPPELELTITLPLMTGIRGKTVRHLTPSWLVDDGEQLSIHVPNRAACVVGDEDGGCIHCRATADGYFTTQRRSRTIPVHDDRVAKILRVRAKTSDLLAYRAVFRSFQKVLERTGIERDVNYNTLIHTFGVALGAKGYDREEIQRWMGYDPTRDRGQMLYAKNYAAVGATSPWNELEALGTGEFRP